MIAVITGDIINSQNSDTEKWLKDLKNLLNQWGESPATREIYRGDEFQIKSSIDEVFQKFLAIKSLIKSHENLDVRIAIGIGEEQFCSNKITESNGTAYVYSGKLLTELKAQSKTVAIKTPLEHLNHDLNLVMKWSALDFDTWTNAVSEVIFQYILNNEITQEDLAKKLNISQSSVSQRVKRANLDLIKETDYYFQKKIAEL